MSPDHLEAIRRVIRRVTTGELVRLVACVETDYEVTCNGILNSANVPPLLGSVPGMWAPSQMEDVRALAECELNERVPTRM